MVVRFSLLNQNAFWLLDNISLIDANTNGQSIQNGNFEDGNLTNWNYCNPNFTSNSSRLAQNGNFSPQSGQNFYFGAPYPFPDFLTQTISTTMGQLYKFSFWLGKTAAGANNRFVVTIFFWDQHISTSINTTADIFCTIYTNQMATRFMSISLILLHDGICRLLLLHRDFGSTWKYSTDLVHHSHSHSLVQFKLFLNRE